MQILLLKPANQDMMLQLLSLNMSMVDVIGLCALL